MRKIYYNIGFLTIAEVVKLSASNLVSQYIEYIGPKTQKLLKKVLRKVLFINKAYRLIEGYFTKEAIDKIIDCLIKPVFAQKLIIILASYYVDINRLISINPSLTSRFLEIITFRALNPQKYLKLFIMLLKKKKHLNIATFNPLLIVFQ